jgi:adenylylsulfate kinase-like enzyme
MLDRQGLHVVCCVLSIFPEMRARNRDIFSSYFEVFLDAPLDVLQAHLRWQGLRRHRCRPLCQRLGP